MSNSIHNSISKAGGDNTNPVNRKKNSCGLKCEIYSRVTGYFRPVANWNIGKKEEFNDRLNFKVA
jgi:anaerobic ribonucleoside-triphosphate reductase